ncbi:MAG: ATP-binding cassette domain-containing protein [Eubacteriales bacterium]|nr:ATP-binding cassette domain-containing protein [Eubacteriales bacterium]
MEGIVVKNLSRDFEYYEKEAGMKSSIQNLFHRKKQIRHAVKNISFEVQKGEMVGFLGPNGAGKTTTIKMLSGILHPTSGEISVNGYVPWERKNEFKKQFAYVAGQKSQLWINLPAVDSFALNKSIYELSDTEYKQTLGELVELFGVQDFLKVQVRRLSLGERMKMEMIAALLHRPKVILLDEPTIGLDFIAQNNIREFLKDYNRKNGVTMLLTSHYLKDIEELCHRTIVISHGDLVYNGTLEHIRNIFSKKRLLNVRWNAPVGREALTRLGALKSWEPMKAVLEVEDADVAQTIQRLFEISEVGDINIEAAPLEESIARLYGQEAREADSEQV